VDHGAREQLAKMVATYGRDIVDDPRRCEALLRDLCAALPREVNILVSALRSGLPGQLAASAPSVPVPMRVAQLADHLRDSQGLTPEAALWAVESWAVALGVMAAADATPLADGPRGEDLVLNVTLSAAEAQAGCRKKVSHEGRTLSFKFPAGTISGREFRIAGKGQPAAGGGPRGDLVVTAQVALASGAGPALVRVGRQTLTPDPTLLKRLPAHVWIQHGAVPLQTGPKGVEIALSDPDDLPTVDALRATFGAVRVVRAHDADIRDALAAVARRATAPAPAPPPPPPPAPSVFAPGPPPAAAPVGQRVFAWVKCPHCGTTLSINPPQPAGVQVGCNVCRQAVTLLDPVAPPPGANPAAPLAGCLVGLVGLFLCVEWDSPGLLLVFLILAGVIAGAGQRR
jgi:hypothetical protein